MLGRIWSRPRARLVLLAAASVLAMALFGAVVTRDGWAAEQNGQSRPGAKAGMSDAMLKDRVSTLEAMQNGFVAIA